MAIGMYDYKAPLSPGGSPTYTLVDSYLNDPYYTGLKAAAEKEGATQEDKQAYADLQKQQYQQRYGGMGEAALGDFQKLLGRLTQSKIAQQQAKDISARPNIYAQGLAQMMGNF